MSDDSNPNIVNLPTSGVPQGVLTGLRYIITTIGGWLVGRGYITSSDATQLVGVVLAIAPTAWGVYEYIKNRNKIIKVNDPTVTLKMT